MATVTTTHVIDDIDGSTEATTIRFSVGRSHYEIDLSEENTDKLYEALQPFISKARKVSATTAAAPSRAARLRLEHAAIRQWAKENGINVNDRGRLPNDLIERYKAAHT
ncbi:Lsr2 family protein [Rhodococcus hoagii]|nr:Lsr2 family protein [Prescottella equi]MBM4654046.1 Lsr2 family protein [Prescottella equi]MBM4719691.1 Lsr2 family protein [Prescottella equi]NKR23488.1 Lsr2 family protein [Prescottella equi]NKT56358.1 Lsr2 family protein [Prescottella equi]